MLKFFYRLKRRGGVVLFAVVAIMTILIVMASVAYFTARSSYQTVVSNYDFSQTYLSTTSVADMVLSAVAFDSYKDEASGNDYDGLRDLLKGVETKVKKDITDKADALKKSYKAANPDFPDDGIFPILVNEINYGEYGASDRKKTFSYEENGDVKSDVASLNNTDIEALVVSGSTTNIKDKTGDDLIDASMDAPVKGGILDACEVKITLDWAEVVPPSNPPKSEDDKYTSFRYYYTFTTTGYYRGNSISVQDTVYHDATDGAESGLPQFDTFFTCSAQYLKSDGKKDYVTGRCVVINTKLISDNAYFQNDYTVMTGIKGTSAFTFLGGVRTKGSLYIDSDMKGTLPKPEGDRRHDWIIGEDLYLSGNAGLDFNGNCLYIKGDLYLASGTGNGFKNLGACIVEGNVYLVDSSVHGFFSTGNYDSLGVDDVKDSDGNIIKKHRVEPQGLYIGKGVYLINDSSSKKSDYTNYMNNINAIINSTLHKSQQFQNVNKTLLQSPNTGNFNTFNGVSLYYNSDIDIEIGSNTLPPAKDSFTDPSAVFSFIEKEGEGDKSKYEFRTKDQTVSKILSDTSNRKPYEVYSAKKTAQDAVLTIDFSLFNNDDKHKTQEQVVGTVTSEVDGSFHEATFKIENNKAILTLPFVPGGYTLKWVNPSTSEEKWVHKWWTQRADGSWGEDDVLETVTTVNAPINWGSDDLYINICTGSYKDPTDSTKTIRTMPIILTANFFDGNNSVANGTQKDENGYNAFSWKLGHQGNDHTTVVQLLNEDGTDSAEDFVIFEMGNYKRGEYDNSTGEYKNGGPYEQYSKDKVDSLETVVYYSPQKHFLGTKNQFDVLGGVENTDSSDFDPFFADKATGQLKEDYENKLMIVSAKNNGKLAVYAPDIDYTTTCGYIYAPNGNYTADCSNDPFAVFGGMIVSDYTLNHAHFLYAMPNPQLIEGLQTGFDDITGDKTVASTVWHIDGNGTGKNYLG